MGIAWRLIRLPDYKMTKYPSKSASKNRMKKQASGNGKKTTVTFHIYNKFTIKDFRFQAFLMIMFQQAKTIYKTIFLVHVLLPFVFSRIFEKNC
jgi:hypothetical protein